ncbi:MAG: Rieske (2Fe-2S) protein [Hamadaea sp.]|nr:Rieske (2Fe-2S) protein [Hamadaea sp.]NUR52721.1 Rieske (2Fe-2S) protein [Hamadaea sp.]NUT03709.1 Rieske (2Fe-2S) protein [Hamadaea sp.]
MTERTENTPSTSRRTLFASAGAVGAAALLTACSAEETPSTATTTAAGGGTTGATAGATSGSTGSTGGGSGGTAIAQTGDIPVGGGKIIAAAGVVVTQPTAGTFKAFDSMCTHQQCPLSGVANGTINCDCHFSKFSITDGSVVSPPATKALAEKTIVVEGTDIKLK